VIVVDASALSAFILREEGWRKLAKYMVRSISIDHIVKEVANTIWKATYIRKVLTVEEALKAFKTPLMIIATNIPLYSQLTYLNKPMDISLQPPSTIYDSLYIAQAIIENKPLLTLDEKQKRIAKALRINVLP